PDPEAAWPAAASVRRALAIRVPAGWRRAAPARPWRAGPPAWPGRRPTPSALSSRLALPVPPSAAPRRRASARWPPFDTAAAHLLALAVWRSFAAEASSSHKQARLRESKET